MSYQITITDPTDLFFHLTSIDITPEVFHLMTESFKMELPIKRGEQPTLSRSTGTFHHNLDVGGGQVKQWFHDPTGERGVVGVISGDFMSGAILQPERYLGSSF